MTGTLKKSSRRIRTSRCHHLLVVPKAHLRPPKMTKRRIEKSYAHTRRRTLPARKMILVKEVQGTVKPTFMKRSPRSSSIEHGPHRLHHGNEIQNISPYNRDI